MSDLKDQIRSYTGGPLFYTKFRQAMIVKGKEKSVVLKKRGNQRMETIYQYLQSRDCDFLPKMLTETPQYTIYDYVMDAGEPDEQRAHDLIYLVSLLHNKTTYFVHQDMDEIKIIYEDTNVYLNDLYHYYTELMNAMEQHEYMSPAEYMFMRHCTILFQSISFAKRELEVWYELVKAKNKKRMVYNHNNLRVDHVLRNEKLYLISWDKASFNSPIYDLYFFFRAYYDRYDFPHLFSYYESRYPLLKEERILLFVLWSIPPLINMNQGEYVNTRNCFQLFRYLARTEELLTPYYSNEGDEKEKEK